MTRPRLLDLYCGAGGAAMGYYRAGFDVVGVDIREQPHYPFAFDLADALTYRLDGFDAIHASPPCRDHTSLAALHGEHGDGWQLEATIARLSAHGAPYIVENVDGADMGRSWVVVCGASLGLGVDGHVLRRHRRFVSNVGLLVPGCACRRRSVIGVYGHTGGATRRGRTGSGAQAAEAMGIGWMSTRELAKAIPPAYTQMLGEQLRAAL